MLKTKLNDEEERYFKDTSKELELLSLCFERRTYRAVEKTILMPLQYKYVHNLIDGRFEDVEGVDRILGYESCRFTLDFYYQILHPDDRNVTFEMTRKSISWANYNLPLKAEDMQLNVLQRIRKANDEYAYIFRQSIITAVVGNRIARTFSLCTNVTDMGMKTINLDKNWNKRLFNFYDWAEKYYGISEWGKVKLAKVESKELEGPGGKHIITIKLDYMGENYILKCHEVYNVPKKGYMLLNKMPVLRKSK